MGKPYNWQQHDWPHFRYDPIAIEPRLLRYAESKGKLSGTLLGLAPSQQRQLAITQLTNEALTTSAIEGEVLSRQDVISSVRNSLGMNRPTAPVRDRRAQGVAAMMVHARGTFRDDLSERELFTWHELLFGSSSTFSVGAFRTHSEPMQVISGPIGKARVHFEAPPSKGVPKEMRRLVAWFNATAPGKRDEIPSGAVRAALAHLYFESVHPFEDGNGRLGRTLSEKALSQAQGQPISFSLSLAIEAKKKLYYSSLENAQRSNEVTPWILYFVSTLLEAQKDAQERVEFVAKKGNFLDRLTPQINERQAKVITRMLRDGPSGFEGGINATKYMHITRCSKATATRDLTDLEAKGALRRKAGGRSTHYEVALKRRP